MVRKLWQWENLKKSNGLKAPTIENLRKIYGLKASAVEDLRKSSGLDAIMKHWMMNKHLNTWNFKGPFKNKKREI